MATVNRLAPILPVRDVKAALAFYARLGFATREWKDGNYGFLTRDGVELHVGAAAAGSETVHGSVYFWVDDADALAREWRESGAEVHEPEDTPWGQHEGALVDLDGNVIRFGSPPTGSGPGSA